MTLTELTTSQSQAAQVEKALAQRGAIQRNAEIRRRQANPDKFTRPLTLQEWREVKPSGIRRLWRKVRNLFV